MKAPDASPADVADVAEGPRILAVPYSDAAAARWDQLVSASYAGTFLHSRRFLGYHGARFRDLSLLLEDERHELLGVFPAAADRDVPGRVVSHPGITYGGVVHAGALRGERMVAAFEAARAHWSAQGFETLRYKAVPHIYHRVPGQDDLYALFRLNARRYRCDLSCTIDFARREAPSSRRIRAAKQATKNGIQVETGANLAPRLWAVLEENLAEKHGVKPVHSLAEILQLEALFPSNVEFVAGLHDGAVVAGVVLFRTERVSHAQYIASSSSGAKLHALDAVLEHCIRAAQARSMRYFDFGISNERDGRHLNSGLHRFKSEFGGGGVVHEFFELDTR